MIDENIEAMSQIIEEEMSITISNEKIKSIVQAYDMHLENLKEMHSYQHIDRNQECEKCKSLKREIEDYESRERVWSESVKNKITGATRVYMTDRNEIKYDLI